MSLDPVQINVMSIDVLTSQYNEKKIMGSRLNQHSNPYDDIWAQDTVMVKNIADGDPQVVISPYTTNKPYMHASSPYSSSHFSDRDSDSSISLSPVLRTDTLSSHYSPVDKGIQDENEEASANGPMNENFKDLKSFEIEYPYYYTYFHHHQQQQQKQQNQGNKTETFQTRKARNKLASAKYRAKKQALTHAMQERILQLATQIKNLRHELSITKKNEADIWARYNHLLNLSRNQTIIKKEKSELL